MKKYLKKIILTVFFVFAGVSCVSAPVQSAEAKAKKPVVSVKANQVKQGNVTYFLQGQTLQIRQDIENNSKNMIKKVEASYSYEWSAAPVQPVSPGAVEGEVSDSIWKQQTVTARTGSIKKGKTAVLSAELELEVPSGYEVQQVRAVKIVELRIYSKTGVVIIDKLTGKTRIAWGTKDTKAPVIKGIVGKNAYNRHYKDVCRVVYKGEEKWLLKAVSAYDDRDGEVKVTVDTSKINWNQKGIYTVVYQAKDAAGNIAKVKTKVQVRKKSDDIDRYASTILKRIVKSNWSDTKKAKAIYRYVRGKMTYVDSNDHKSWERSAVYALRYNSGNCFCYYSLSRLLLTRCGIISQVVTRYRGHGHHWWNYVYVQGGWYHYDTTPRRIRGNFCLRTGAQLTAYSRRAGNSHIWNPKWIPKGAVKKITK